MITRWGHGGLSQDAELLAAELLTNAAAAQSVVQPAGPVRLCLLSDATKVVILVSDGCAAPPVPANPSQDAVDGRGLLLVDAIATEWGWHRGPGRGKTVWALLSASTE